MGLRTLRASALILALAGASCVGRPPSLPAGLWQFSPRVAVAQLTEVANQCSAGDASKSWSAELAIHGSAGGDVVDQRLRVAFEPASSFARIESVPARGNRSFVLTNAPDGATFLFDGGRRVLERTRFSSVLDALLGMDLGPLEFSELIRGCHLLEPQFGFPTTFGDRWLLVHGGRNGRMYYYRRSPADPWRMLTMFYPGEGLEAGWRLDYSDLREGLARRLHVTGLAAGPMDLDIRLQTFDLRVALPPDLFTIAVPSFSQPTTLEDLNVHLFTARPGRSD